VTSDGAGASLNGSAGRGVRAGISGCDETDLGTQRISALVCTGEGMGMGSALPRDNCQQTLPAAILWKLESIKA